MIRGFSEASQANFLPILSDLSDFSLLPFSVISYSSFWFWTSSTLTKFFWPFLYRPIVPRNYCPFIHTIVSIRGASNNLHMILHYKLLSIVPKSCHGEQGLENIYIIPVPHDSSLGPNVFYYQFTLLLLIMKFTYQPFSHSSMFYVIMRL